MNEKSYFDKRQKEFQKVKAILQYAVYNFIHVSI